MLGGRARGVVVSDAARYRAARGAVDQARNLGHTCSASRHVHTLLDDLLAGRVPQHLIDEPQHCGESIAAVLAELWQRRAAGQGDESTGVVVGYLVTLPNGYEARLGPDLTRAQVYAVQQHAARIEPMVVRRMPPAAGQAGAGATIGPVPVPG